MPDPVFTPEQIKDDGKNRVGKTGGQAGLGAALVIVITAALNGRGLLDGELPQVVHDAWVVIATMAVASAMNFNKLRGKH